MYHLEKWRQTGERCYAENAVQRMEPEDLASLTEGEARALSDAAGLSPIEILIWAEEGKAPVAIATAARRIQSCAKKIVMNEYPLHFNAALCEKIRAAAAVVAQEPVPQGSGWPW